MNSGVVWSDVLLLDERAWNMPCGIESGGGVYWSRWFGINNPPPPPLLRPVPLLLPVPLPFPLFRFPVPDPSGSTWWLTRCFPNLSNIFIVRCVVGSGFGFVGCPPACHASPLNYVRKQGTFDMRRGTYFWSHFTIIWSTSGAKELLLTWFLMANSADALRASTFVKLIWSVESIGISEAVSTLVLFESICLNCSLSRFR